MIVAIRNSAGGSLAACMRRMTQGGLPPMHVSCILRHAAHCASGPQAVGEVGRDVEGHDQLRRVVPGPVAGGEVSGAKVWAL